MTTRPKGRRLDPIEAFEVIPWRAMALFRVTTVIYAIVLIAHNSDRYPQPVAAWTVAGAMAVWSGLTVVGYEQASRRAWPLLLVDLTSGRICWPGECRR